jgi:cation diffusion facilitator family transporter
MKRLTAWLCALFIRDAERVEDPLVRRAYGTLASIVGIVLNLLLFAGKFAVGTLFGAVSVLADAMNNLSDALSQMISLISFRIAAKPADRGHPFGHARMEYVASTVVAMLILMVGYELFKESVGKILHPEMETAFSVISVIVLAVAILVKLWPGLFNRTLGKQIGSSVLVASAVDSLSDAGATTAVLLSQLVLRYTGFDADGYVGFLVAILIVVAGIRVLKEAMDAILGQGPSESEVENVRRVIFSYPEALGMHDLLVHSYGTGHTIASLHVEVDGSGDIYRLHDVMDNMEKQLLDDHGIQATIHMDPIVTGNETVDTLRTQAVRAVRTVDERIRIHDFRAVIGCTHTNLIFDVAVPYEVALDDEAIVHAVAEAVRREDESYRVVLTVDRE